MVRWSARYEETVTFYRDTIGLPVLETFHDSYGLDGTILGLPGGQVHLAEAALMRPLSLRLRMGHWQIDASRSPPRGLLPRWG